MGGANRKREKKLRPREAAARAPLNSFDAVPPEFSNISDGERYLHERKAELSSRRAALEEAIKSRSAAQSVLDRFMEELHFDPYEELDRATRQFQEQKSELKHWRHIQETFETLKKQMSSSPMQGFAESFSNYLNIITGGKVTSVFKSLEKLDVDVFSDGRPLNFDTLSEGTKETVSLAYRLAVLDHLFPEGGGGSSSSTIHLQIWMRRACKSPPRSFQSAPAAIKSFSSPVSKITKLY